MRAIEGAASVDRRARASATLCGATILVIRGFEPQHKRPADAYRVVSTISTRPWRRSYYLSLLNRAITIIVLINLIRGFAPRFKNGNGHHPHI